jgi:hypothetical protein
MPAGHGTATSRRDITDMTSGRIGDPRDRTEAAAWQMLNGNTTSDGMRRIRDGAMDRFLDAVEAAYRPAHRIIEVE